MKIKKYINGIIIAASLIGLVYGCSEDMGLDSSGSDSGQGGSMARFTIADNHLYTVDHRNLRIFDISNPKKPVFKKKENIGFDIETIFVLDKLLFIGSEWAMYIYNIDNPENPIKLSEYSHIYSCDPVVANKEYAFVTLSTSSSCGRWSNELHVVDISDPYEPTEVAIHNMSNPKGLGLKGDTLYVCDADQIKVYDVSDVQNINLIQSIYSPAFDLIPLQNSLVAIGEEGFTQYSYSNDSLAFLSEIKVSQTN